MTTLRDRTVRDELIEMAARAISARNDYHIGGPDAEVLVRGKQNWTFRIPDAEVAVNAILERLREPDEAMCLALSASIVETTDSAENIRAVLSVLSDGGE